MQFWELRIGNAAGKPFEPEEADVEQGLQASLPGNGSPRGSRTEALVLVEKETNFS